MALDKLKDVWGRVILKITSARFLVAILMTLTYCKIMLMALDLSAEGKISKEFFFGLFAGFSGMVGSVITFYYTRPDRKKTKEKS